MQETESLKLKLFWVRTPKPPRQTLVSKSSIFFRSQGWQVRVHLGMGYWAGLSSQESKTHHPLRLMPHLSYHLSYRQTAA